MEKAENLARLQWEQERVSDAIDVKKLICFIIILKISSFFTKVNLIKCNESLPPS